MEGRGGGTWGAESGRSELAGQGVPKRSTPEAVDLAREDHLDLLAKDGPSPGEQGAASAARRTLVGTSQNAEHLKWVYDE